MRAMRGFPYVPGIVFDTHEGDGTNKNGNFFPNKQKFVGKINGAISGY